MSSTSPVATSTTVAKRVTSVLPKAAKTNISLFIHQCAENGSIDATTALAMKNLLDDRSFAMEYKAALANILDEQKTKRAENRAIREKKKSEKNQSNDSSDEEEQAPIKPDTNASSGVDNLPKSSPESPVSSSGSSCEIASQPKPSTNPQTEAPKESSKPKTTEKSKSKEKKTSKKSKKSTSN